MRPICLQTLSSSMDDVVFHDVPVDFKLEEEQKYELIVIMLTFFRTLQKIKVGFRSHKKGKIPKT